MKDKKRIPEEQNTAQRPAAPPMDADRAAFMREMRMPNKAPVSAQQLQPMQAMPPVQVPAVPGITAYQALGKVIGKEEVLNANASLQRYREGKHNLEQRIIDNEQWFKLRHWDCMRNGDKSQVEPSSAWLFNCIANKHADAMDNFPAPNILPREKGDKAEATMLSSIIPVILDMNDFEEVYDNVWDYKLKAGTGIYGVFWDKGALNGL